MSDELLTLTDLAELYRCSYRHARDVITKLIGFPSLAPGSTLFSKLCRELLIEDLTFHDTRGTALTHLSRKVDVLTLAKISRHKNLSLLSNVYYRETADSIAARI